MALPFTLEPLSEAEKLERSKLFQSPPSVMVDMVVSKPGNVYLPRRYSELAQSIKSMELRSDDVFLITYPKAGSTWNQEMVWQIVHNFDVEGGKKHVLARSPFLEVSSLCGDDHAVPPPPVDGDQKALEAAKAMAEVMADSVGYVANLPSPRVIKTHLPLEFLPDNLLEKCKVIWTARNVKDTVVSFYHHEQLLPVHKYVGTFDQYADLFMKGQSLYGGYWHHLEQGWKIRDHPNVKFVWYEDMKKDIRSVIRDLASFLGSSEYEKDSKVELLADHLSFEKFKNNPSVNMKPPKGSVPDEVRDNFNFIRKGEVGDWKNFFKGATLDVWDAWIKENNKLDIPIDFE